MKKEDALFSSPERARHARNDAAGRRGAGVVAVDVVADASNK